MRRSGATIAFVAATMLIACLAGSAPAVAQSGSQALDSALATLTELEFNFSNPGARSLAMGGAFVGRADDASAAYANPAGLVQLVQPEVSAEARLWTYTAKVGLPRQEGDRFEPAPEVDLETGGVLFTSYVYPRDRWTLAAYRFNLAGYDFSDPELGSAAADLVAYGLAGAYRFDNGLSLGAVLIRNEGSVEVAVPCPPADEECSGLFVNRVDDSDVVANVGLLWRLGERWSVGAVYREGPRFAIPEEVVEAAGQEANGLPELQVPDVVGIGFGVRANSRLVINADVMRVRYSQAPEAVGLETISKPDGQPFGAVTLDDVTEIHLGLEYSFWNVKGAPALRFGSWWDPAHKIRFSPDAGLSTGPGPSGFSDAEVAAAFADRFDGGEDRLHVSAGFGFVIGRRFQLDAGIDVSDETESVSLSTLVRF